MKNILNYIKINNQISTSAQPTKKEFKKIAKEGFEVIVNLAMHNKGALKEEDKIVSKNGMLYIHIPINWKKPEIDRVIYALKVIELLEKDKKRIWIHCIKNYRASVIIHLYKKYIWQKVDIEFISPKEYRPNKRWKKILNMDIKSL